MPRKRRLLALPLLAVLLALTVAGQCPCPECPPPPQAAAKLVLEDTHSAVWMTFDNDFVSNPGTISACASADTTTDAGRHDAFGECTAYSTAFRPGIVFQIGHAIEATGASDNFDHILLTFSDTTTQKIDETDFDWLDVNGHSDCALDALHAYSLFKNAVVEVDCDGATLVVPPLPDPPFPDTCLRQRALHASFRPDVGVVTYWPGASYYEMKAEAGGHGHIAHTFSLLNPVTIDRWKGGCFEERYSNVTEVRIVYVEPSSDHTQFPHSPIDGANYKPQ